ncbi:MAG: glycosyltransferase [Aristaeellaceae bacterium]
MNILYIAFKDFSKLHFGASKKVISECRAFESLGHSVTLIGREKNATVFVTTSGGTKPLRVHKQCPLGKLQTLLDKEHQIRDVLAYVRDQRYDYCYIRFDLCTRSFLKLLKGLKSVCDHIDMEIPTYPYEKEYSGKLNRIRLALDQQYARQLPRYVDRIISFYEIPGNSFHGVPVLLVPNGFDFDGIEIVKDDTVPQDIHIAAVSSMRHWHGYERMIEGLHRYYQDGGKRNFVLHIVGDGREGPKYRTLTEQYALNEHVIFHGAMHGKELDDLLESCMLGVDSLARHRTGISRLSSLKSREYGAKGLPIINSCDIDIVGDDFAYFLKVPADETPVDMQSVADFYDRCFACGSRQQVAKEVRAYIEKRSSMQAVMKQVLEAGQVT